MDESFVALQQHFADTRRTAIITVNLERRMRAEEIRKSSAAMTACFGIYRRIEQAAE